MKKAMYLLLALFLGIAAIGGTMALIKHNQEKEPEKEIVLKDGETLCFYGL